MGYTLTLMRPGGMPTGTFATKSPLLVAATLEGWLDHAPDEWFDEHGELTVRIMHDGHSIDTAVLAEHVKGFRDLTDDDEAIAQARNTNVKRRPK